MRALALTAIALVALGVGCVTRHPPAPSPGVKDLVVVESPPPGAAVTSPLTVRGRAQGSWYFEAVFPVRLVDAKGNVLASGPARAQGEWMTPEFVDFAITLTFAAPSDSATGTLVLERSNPSGLPEHAAEVRVPVRFR